MYNPTVCIYPHSLCITPQFVFTPTVSVYPHSLCLLPQFLSDPTVSVYPLSLCLPPQLVSITQFVSTPSYFGQPPYKHLIQLSTYTQPCKITPCMTYQLRPSFQFVTSWHHLFAGVRPNLDRYVFVQVNEDVDGLVVEAETVESG